MRNLEPGGITYIDEGAPPSTRIWRAIAIAWFIIAVVQTVRLTQCYFREIARCEVRK